MPPDERVNPVGSAPLVTLKLYGPVPPLALRVCECAVFAVALASFVGVSVRVGAVTVRLTVAGAEVTPPPVAV